MGSTANGDLKVNGVSAASSDNVGTITLVATKAAKVVSFITGASKFNKGIIVQSMGGIILSQSVSTQVDPTALSTGTGTLTLDGSSALSTNSQLLTITVHDIDIQDSATINTGTAVLGLECYTEGETAGFGSTAKDLTITGAELQQISATGLTMGGANCDSVVVDGVSEAHSATVSSVLSFVMTRDDASIVFSTATSTFNALSVQADNGISVQVNLNTDTDWIYMEGDFDNSSTEDSRNNVAFADAVTVVAKEVITLEATSGSIIPAGSLTLTSGSGVVLHDHMTGAASNKPLVIDADFESEGDGTLTIVTGKTVTSNKSDVTITAWDLDISGSLTAHHGSQHPWL
jgi:hypothetical protein